MKYFKLSILIIFFLIIIFVRWLFLNIEPSNYTLIVFISLVYVDLKYSKK